MNTNRRGFIKTAGLGLAALGLFGANARSSNSSDSFKIGMCDWNVRNQKGESGTCRPDFIPIAAEAHLKGIQVSVGYLDQRNNDTVVPLRDPAVRNEYLELGKKHGIQFHSVAAGSICNSIALGYEPESAIYVVDALEAAAALGAKNILIAFFGNGDLRLRDSTGAMRNISDGPYHTYELDAKAVGRVVRVLKQIAPRAEDLGVAMGLENTLSADQNLEESLNGLDRKWRRYTMILQTQPATATTCQVRSAGWGTTASVKFISKTMGKMYRISNILTRRSIGRPSPRLARILAMISGTSLKKADARTTSSKIHAPM